MRPRGVLSSVCTAIAWTELDASSSSPVAPPARAPMAYRVTTGVAEGGTSVVGMRAGVVLAEVIS